MFRRKNDNTKIGTIEQQYSICLNARADTLLGNLLDDRGFDSLSQLLDAYYCRLTYHARRRRAFLSFHAEDEQQVDGFCLMVKNSRLDLDIYDSGLQTPINSKKATYVKKVIRAMINRVPVVICLIGNGTVWRDWVDWELNIARDLGKGICGVRLKGSHGQIPPLLKETGSPVAKWNMTEIIATIECAAAKRS